MISFHLLRNRSPRNFEKQSGSQSLHRKAASPEELQERLRGAVVAVNIRAYSKFTPELLASCRDLKMIAVLASER